MQLRVCKAELAELRQSLRFVEFQLAKSQENCEEMRVKLENKQGRYEQTVNSVETLKQELLQSKHQISDLSSKLASAHQTSEEQLQGLKAQIETLLQSLHSRDRQLLSMEQEKSELLRKIQDLEKEAEERDVQMLRLDEELRIKTKELGYLQVKMMEGSTQMTLDSVQIQLDTLDPKVAELQQLHTEKEHLLRLIRTSPQLKELSEYSEDSCGMRYLPRPGLCSRKGCPGSGINWECEDWVPQEVYRLAEDFSMRYKGNIDPSDVKELVRNMNAVWRYREINRIRRVKKTAGNTIKSLQRQLVLNSASSADLREVQRLKAQLREMIAAKRREEAESIEVTSVAFSQDEEAPSEVEMLHQVVQHEASKLLDVIQSAIEEQFDTPINDTSMTIRHSQDWLMVLCK